MSGGRASGAQGTGRAVCRCCLHTSPGTFASFSLFLEKCRVDFVIQMQVYTESYPSLGKKCREA